MRRRRKALAARASELRVLNAGSPKTSASHAVKQRIADRQAERGSGELTIEAFYSVYDVSGHPPRAVERNLPCTEAMLLVDDLLAANIAAVRMVEVKSTIKVVGTYSLR